MARLHAVWVGQIFVDVEAVLFVLWGVLGCS